MKSENNLIDNLFKIEGITSSLMNVNFENISKSSLYNSLWAIHDLVEEAITLEEFVSG